MNAPGRAKVGGEAAHRSTAASASSASGVWRKRHSLCGSKQRFGAARSRTIGGCREAGSRGVGGSIWSWRVGAREAWVAVVKWAAGGAGGHVRTGGLLGPLLLRRSRIRRPGCLWRGSGRLRRAMGEVRRAFYVRSGPASCSERWVASVGTGLEGLPRDWNVGGASMTTVSFWSAPAAKSPAERTVGRRTMALVAGVHHRQPQ
jgi:hypothetical protein